ncbi:alpha/beta fold hydrolase [Jannaschia rubra]|uniref:Phospholipase YtpA n=1 Tax=Jannaschia rubra TaxID=282197 RepID=A0A0M6XNX2_9RHOB|nr:alpha/beta hydrolase [Jannaschia rubra]CTQ32372.1 Phospholipase YtpA [Jannaschia rubra]SFG45960.1 lysophospholipase [Jannaschia rubra]
MQAAPYHDDVAAGPPGGHAVWADTSDGVRLRVGLWPEGTRGTLLMYPGRTEYIEKYSDAARELASRGYASAAIDWRGQGLSPRSPHDPHLGHVNDFRDFQRDVDAFHAACKGADLPRPWHVLGHSMGGLIALRALHRRTDIGRAVFSAPMWGLPLTPHRRFMAWGLSWVGSTVGLGQRLAPGAGKVADPAAAPFDGNLLTTDREMFAWMKRQIVTHPELALGGPSLGWVWAALREMHGLARDAAPQVSCLAFLGTDEDIVSADAIHVRMGSWKDATLEMVEGARHEVLMESEATRARIFDRIAAHLDQ